LKKTKLRGKRSCIGKTTMMPKGGKTLKEVTTTTLKRKRKSIIERNGSPIEH